MLESLRHIKKSPPWLCCLTILLLMLLGSGVKAQSSNFDLFSETELSEIKQKADEELHRLRLLHKCAESEASTVCFTRACNINFDDAGKDYFAVTRMSDEHLRCMFKGSPELELALEMRKSVNSWLGSKEYVPDVNSESFAEALADSSADNFEVSDPLAEALADALSGKDARYGPSAELWLPEVMGGMQLAISPCWNLSSFSNLISSTVVVGMELTVEGRPLENSIYLCRL